MKQFYQEYARLTEYLQSIALLFARLIVAYGFYEPAMIKWKDIGAVAQWFESMGIPLPLLNAYLAASAETAGVILLALGLMVRFITVPLMVVMLVAIITVHLSNGFSASNNGFEIPLYYFLFLMIFMSHGAGRFSLDRLIFGKRN